MGDVAGASSDAIGLAMKSLTWSEGYAGPKSWSRLTHLSTTNRARSAPDTANRLSVPPEEYITVSESADRQGMPPALVETYSTFGRARR